MLSDGGESTEVFLQQPINSNGLLAHWPFNEGEGTKTSESTGYTEGAQLRGGVTWTPSAKEELGSALSLWGEEQSYLDLGSFNLGGGAMSLTGWLKLRSLGDGIRVLDFADDEYGTNALLLTNSQSSNAGSWTVVNSLGNQLGWTVATLSGDEDSNISSEYQYTCAINLHGTNLTINGVPFDGTTASPGNGWSLTAGFGNSVGSSDSSVSGSIGTMLDQGFKFSGDPQKIMLSGLTDGQSYRFSLYSQAWGGNRFCELSCSDLPGTITVDQDQNHGQNPDGLLVECTYVAEGSEVEFTIDPIGSGTWHLYAFSNRVEPLDRDESEVLVDSLWKLNEWQHLAITIEEDGQTKFYSDGDFIASQQGNVPADLNRSFHILGGNRLGMDQFNPIDLEGLKTLAGCPLWTHRIY